MVVSLTDDGTHSFPHPLKVETAGDCYIVAGALMALDDEGFLSVEEYPDAAKGAEKVMTFAKVRQWTKRNVLEDGSSASSWVCTLGQTSGRLACEGGLSGGGYRAQSKSRYGAFVSCGVLKRLSPRELSLVQSYSISKPLTFLLLCHHPSSGPPTLCQDHHDPA